ncbi:MAG TPA: carboxypeptidase-like regulatory domain-containing protein, partial [Hymenobacter sp.]
MKSLPARHCCSALVHLLLVLLGVPLAAVAQTTTVEGVVTDAKTRERLPYVSVAVPQAGVGTNTDDNGRYSLRVPAGYTTIVVSYLGYRTVTKTLVAGVPQEINVQLTTSSAVLNEVVVKGTKLPRYKNKDNPAVALIRKVIDHKEQNRPESYDFVEYDRYEKMAFSFSDLTE